MYMCKFGAHRTTSTAKKWDSRGYIFASARTGRVSGFWRFLGKYLGTGPKIPYWEPTGENPWISVPEDIPTLTHGTPERDRTQPCEEQLHAAGQADNKAAGPRA